MNELKPCAPLSLKLVLAQEVVKGLQAVSESLVRYNAMRMLRGNESSLFISLCQAFIEVTLASYMIKNYLWKYQKKEKVHLCKERKQNMFKAPNSLDVNYSR
jgi:hypothetical protein